MAKLEEVGSESKRPEVNPGTKPRAHLREPHSATASSSSTTTTFTNGGNVGNVQDATSESSSLQQPPIGQESQWGATAVTKPPPGFKLAYAYVPDGTALPRKLDSQTSSILRAFGTGLTLGDLPKKENRPPPLPPKPKSDASASQTQSVVSDMMASLSKLMASNLFQSEKMLSNSVSAPINGFYNIYSEVGDRYLDLDQTNTKEGTTIIAWPHIFMHNPAQTVRQFILLYCNVPHNNAEISGSLSGNPGRDFYAPFKTSTARGISTSIER